MNQLSCDIVKDMLPLYVDNVCSEQSKDAIEEHLSICESCRIEYEAMCEEPPAIVSEESSFEQDIKQLKKRFQVKTVFPVIILGLLILVLCFIYPLFSPFLHSLSLIPTKDIHVTELYQLEDGRIFCTLKSDKKITQASTSPLAAPEMGLTYDWENGWSEIRLYSSMFKHNAFQSQELSVVFSLNVTYGDTNDSLGKSNAISYVGKYNEQLLIWKKGQPIKSAPKEIEEKVIAEQDKIRSFYDSSEEFNQAFEESQPLLIME